MRKAQLALSLFFASACGSESLSLRPPLFSASTDVVDFGERFVGFPEERTVFLINKGEKTLELGDISGDTLGGTFSTLLNQSSIPSNRDAILRVIFSPTEEGSFETILTLSNDSTNEPAFELTLKGSAVTAEPCYQVDCSQAPPPQCINATTSRISIVPGACEEDTGNCTFDSYEETCELGCEPSTGRCAGDPCEGVVCQSPPSSCFKVQGTCVAGSCQYVPDDGATCNDGDPCTVGDACSEGNCRGTQKACDTPPADACTSGETKRIWDPAGFCDAQGSCQYTSNVQSCQFGCSGESCDADPCEVLDCDDNNPCTTDSCIAGVGCSNVNADNAPCDTGSDECPTGVCGGGICHATTGLICQTEINVDLCADVEVAGVCAAGGQCVVEEAPPQFICPGCPGLCLQCFVQICIPFNGGT